MNILRIYPSSINSRSIDEAVGTLRDGGLVIYPTDGLYALGCDALNNRAIEKICRMKGIAPRRNSLSIVCADISQASEYARIDNRAFELMKRVLPGPFTLLLPASTTLPKVFKGRKVVGVRVPDNPVPRALAEALGAPLLSTTAMTPEEIEEDGPGSEPVAVKYASVADLMLDGGEGGSEPSTVVDLTDSSMPEILRQGAGRLEL